MNLALKVADGASGAPAPVTVTAQDVEDANKLGATKKEPLSPTEGEAQLPGNLTGAAPNLPSWYKVGWRDVTGVDAPVPAGEEHDRQVISMFISEQVCFPPRRSPQSTLRIFAPLTVLWGMVPQRRRHFLREWRLHPVVECIVACLMHC